MNGLLQFVIFQYMMVDIILALSSLVLMSDQILLDFCDVFNYFILNIISLSLII